MVENNILKKQYDVIIVGGGISGICAAISSSRNGSRTALIHNRPVLGGNASSEIRMHICGADMHGNRPNARETGIIEEILLENRKRNKEHSFSIFDTVLWEKVKFQEGLDLYLNTQMLEVQTEASKIKSINCYQITTEKNYEFKAEIFIDCTGDGYMAYKAGANYSVGREGKDEFGETHAPEKGDRKTMGNTLMFKAKDTGSPVKSEKPFWAHTITEEQLKNRGHSQSISAMEHYGVDSGYWWAELGGDIDTTSDGEEIRDELLKTVYGIWDHIKNGGEHGAENYELDWIQFLPGKRESRRIMGDYILNEQDVLEAKVFEDAVAYGGWPMDMHPPEGFKYIGDPTDFIRVEDLYTIPYRSYYSNNIDNLMMAGRNISATHMAFGSVRVMATCAIGGQAVGTAAAMAIRYKCMPSGVLNHAKELQQLLMKEDCYIPGFKNEDISDKALNAKVTVSSYKPNCEGSKVINGESRNVKQNVNCWTSDTVTEAGQWLNIHLAKEEIIKEVYIKFDSNLSYEIMTSLSNATLMKQKPGIPKTIVKDYELQILIEGKVVYSEMVDNNYLRLKRHILKEGIKGDNVKIIIKSTQGAENASIFEVRVY